MKNRMVYLCEFCGNACDDSVSCERKKVYMGQTTDTISTSYYCTEKCCHSQHRKVFIPIFEKNIARAMRDIDEITPDYLKVISLPDISIKLIDFVIPLVDYLNTKIAFMKALLERKPIQELTIKQTNYKKCIREMIELSYDDDKDLNKYYSELVVFGNDAHINVFAT